MRGAIALAATRRLNGWRRVRDWSLTGDHRVDSTRGLLRCRFLSSGKSGDEPPETTGEEPKESKTAAKEGNGESNGSSAVSDAAPQSGAIVPATGPRPDRVIAVPLTRRPLFPGFYVPVAIKDSQLAEKLSELKSGGTPWVGAFLLKKGKPRSDGSHLWPASEGGEDNDQQLRGEELFKSLHEYGTFAQVNLWNSLLSQDGNCILVLLKMRMSWGYLKNVDVFEDNPQRLCFFFCSSNLCTIAT